MSTDPEKQDALKETIAEALSIADAQPHHLVAALLAQCLEELGRQGS